MQRLLFMFFFASGFASLVFEIIWERWLVAVFGSTSHALGTLLTAFMFGLALGAWLGSKVVKKYENTFFLYGVIELCIGIFALIAPSIFLALPTIYAPWYELCEGHPYIFNIGRFFVAFVVLAFPTVLMGMTLPLLGDFVSKYKGAVKAKLGALYAVNTIGACAGAFLAGFVLLPALGLSKTNTTFALIDIAVGIIVIITSQLVKTDFEAVEEEDEDVLLAASAPLTKVRPIWIIASLSGFVSMALQISWTRAYVIVLGSSTYSFSLVLTSFLLGLGLGSAFSSALVSRQVNAIKWIVATQLGLCITAAVATGFLDYLPTLLFERSRESIGSVNEMYLYQFGMVAILVCIPMILQGMLFPLLISCLANDKESGGETLGKVYAANTVGSIVGSFTTGFFLLPALGLENTLRLVLALSLFSALAFAWVSIDNKVKLSKAIYIGVPIAVVLIIFAPQIDRAELTRGMFRTYWARELFNKKKFAKDKPKIVYDRDGSNATITVEHRGKLVTLKANGKPEASSGADMATQILVGLAPFLVRSTEEKMGDEVVAMIGYGSGVTAGAALQWPLKEMHVAEIEPAMFEAARFFDEVNHKPHEDKRMFIYPADGRNFLQLSQRKYDIIVSEPSNPWIAGVASLFTTEHFKMVKSRLKKGGVFAQWVQLYEISPDNVRDIIATFSDVFPNAVAFSSMPKGTDLILVASESDFKIRPGGYADAYNNAITKADLKRAHVHSAMDFNGLLFWNNKELLEFAEGGIFNTDDNARLGYRAPKDLIRYDSGRSYFADRYFKRADYGDPRLQTSPLWADWKKEERVELAIAVWKGGKPKLAEQMVSEFSIKGAEDNILLAIHARNLSLEEGAVSAWPFPDSELSKLVRNAKTPDDAHRAIAFLEKEGEPKRGFEGEKGLAYAYLLNSQKYYKYAQRQIDFLADDSLAESLLYGLLKGHIYEKRRRYADSYLSFETVGISLLDAQETLSIRVRIIAASKSGGAEDRKLQDINEKLDSFFADYDTFSEVGAESIRISSKRKGSVKLPDGSDLVVGYSGKSDPYFKLDLGIADKLNSKLRVKPGATFFQAGLKHGDGILVLAITVE